MIIIISALLAVIALLANKFIRKHSVVLYVVALIISIVGIVLANTSIGSNISKMFGPLNKGIIGLALFYLVMLAGALPNKTKLRKTLLGVRKEYSILGFILIAPHAINFIIKWIDGSRPIEWWGLVAFVIMIPLFITSFTKIRKKMSPKNWKKLQSFAYIIYILIFIHLIICASSTPNLVSYLILFIVYFGLKIFYEIKKYLTKKKRNEK